MKKKKGNFMITIVGSSLILILLIIVLFVFDKYKISSESENVSDSLISSELAIFKKDNLDLEQLANDPNIIIVKDMNAALKTFYQHLKYNMNLDDNFNPNDDITFIKSKVSITRFIIYNVINNDVIINDYNPSTGLFSSSIVKDGRGVLKTPKGSLIEASTVDCNIKFQIQGFSSSNLIDMEKCEDADVTK